MKTDVFGKDGDFTTSPEISQVFGEVNDFFFESINKFNFSLGRGGS